MKNIFCSIVLILLIGHLHAQTSWKGTTSTNWSTASNWTAGVPTVAIDAIIGDASFTGAFQPALTANSACKSLTIGAASKVSTLTITRNLTVSGSITIGSNGTILASSANRTITLSGNWINSGTYSATVASALVTFSGAAPTLTGATTFQRMTINTGCILTLANNIIVNDRLSVSGTLDPTASYVVSGTGSFTVNSGGTIRVKAADYASNYTISGTLALNALSTVNYASASINQTVSNALTYGYLRISGGLVKSLAGNLPALNSSSANAGRIYIDAGTFDLLTYTANRGTTVAGGFVIMAAGSILKIGGTNGFPANYNTLSLATTSTVEYYGNNQTVRAATYGNLSFSSSSGAVVKTMPGTALTAAGNFSCTVGAGTGVTFTAGNTITVNRDVTMDASATFNASSFSHVFRGSWTNNGIFSGGTSTATFNGVSAVLSGTGTNNFNNLAFTAAGITASGSTNINVSGNLSASGSGTFMHSASGTLTMTGTTKTLSGNGISLCNFTVSGSVTSSPNFTVSGNLSVAGTYSATTGIMTMNGASKTISGAGAITFNALNFQGSISTAIGFTVKSNFSVAVAGSFTASAGTITFNGTTTLAGRADLYNVTINAARTLTLGTISILGIGNVFTKTGTFNVTTNVPNTVEYNSSGAQNIVGGTAGGDYNNLVLANGGTKTAAANIRVNNDFTVNSSVTFNASSFTFSLYRHFINNGTFTASTSTVQLLGGSVATITGATTFNNLTENKSSALISVNLLNSITTGNLTMTAGNMQTGTNTVTITGTRTGAGIIIGIITHSHAFTNGTAYYFEGAQNAITFTSPSAGLTAVTVTVTLGTVTDFNTGAECVNREYDIDIPAGTYTNATFRMHYEDNELNAFDEPNISHYHYNTGTSVWDSIGITTRSTVTNYVEKTGITTLTGRWTLSGIRKVVRWDGSASSAWGDLNNWTTISGSDMSNRVPNSTDAAEIGQSAFTNNPTITTAQTVNVLRYGSVQGSTVTISSGSLTTTGSVKGLWTGNASHILDVSSGTLTVGTNLDLSDGTSGHDITLKIGSGTATITNNLNQLASAGIVFTGNGTLSIGGNYNYTGGGTFTAGTGTTIYTGTEAQVVAPVTYYNLSFTKSTERATINDPIIVGGTLTTSTGGELAISDTLTVTGNITIGASTTVLETGARINVAGNFTNSGIFTVDDGTVNFNGSGSQTVNANTFNTVLINKSAGTLSLTGNIIVNSDLTLSSGTLDLSTYLADRSNPGGTLLLGASSTLKVAGANNFPNYYIGLSPHATSTVDYYGTVAQNIADVDYGNLTITNGGSTAKSLLGPITVNGDFLINSSSTFDPDSNNITLFGNMTNNGTYTPAASTVILKGTSKILSGSSTLSFYSLFAVGGTYTVTAAAVTLAGDLFLDVAPSSINFGTATITSDGDFTNKGSVTSAGILTFTGTRIQTLSLLGAIVSSSTGVVNFNGTVPFVANSTSPPSFATVNLNNTGGTLAPAQPWTAAVACNIASGVTVDFGPHTHTFLKNFTNNGTVLSSGKLKFMPGAPYSAAGTATLDAGGGTLTSTGEVEYAGTGALTLVTVNPSLTNVSVTNTNAAGVTFPIATTISQDLYIGPGATLIAGTGLSHTFGGNVTNNGTFNGGTSTVSFTGSSAFIDGVGIGAYNNITIVTGADVTLNKSIEIAGNLVVDGNLVTTGRTVTFSGTGASTISGAAGSITFDDLDHNKTGAATTLSIPVTVTNELTLLDGIINTTATNILTLNDDAIATSGTATSFINGPMKKIGDDPFVFPVGKSGTPNIWARIEMVNDASFLNFDPTTVFTCQYFKAAPTNNTAPFMGAGVDHVSYVEYWDLERAVDPGNNAQCNVALYWEDATRSGITNNADLILAHFDASGSNKWENQGGSGVGGASGSITSTTPFTSFSPSAFGSGGGVNPLPVEWLSFNAQAKENKQVELLWATASERNSAYFIVERSRNGIYFSEITSLKAAGNSSTTKSYSIIDNEPLSGVSYYRLKQIDFNGQFAYSNIVNINMNDNNEELLIYPNPAMDKFNIKLRGILNEKVLIVIRDVLGREYYSKVVVLSGADEVITITPDKGFVSGIYTVITSCDNKIHNKKLIIK